LHEIRSFLEKHQKNSKYHGKVLTHFYSLFPEFAPLPESQTPAQNTTTSNSLQSSNSNIVKENPTEETTINPTSTENPTDQDDKKISSDSQLDTGVLRDDLLAEPKYPLRKRIDVLPHPLDSKDPNSLYYKYWKKYRNKT